MYEEIPKNQTPELCKNEISVVGHFADLISLLNANHKGTKNVKWDRFIGCFTVQLSIVKSHI